MTGEIVDIFEGLLHTPGANGWPTSAEVLGELERRDPERYGNVVRFSYFPGSGPPATVEQVADIIQGFEREIAAGGGREVDLDG